MLSTSCGEETYNSVSVGDRSACPLVLLSCAPESLRFAKITRFRINVSNSTILYICRAGPLQAGAVATSCDEVGDITGLLVGLVRMSRIERWIS
jgi:hypothetical protein